MRSRIAGTGSAVTDRLAAPLPPAEVRARLIDVALTASVHALAAAGRRPRDVECVTVASADVRDLASGLGAGLGLVGVPAFGVNGESGAFLYALSAADHFIRLGTYRTVLVTTVDAGAAAATVLVPETAAERGVLAMGLRSDGRFARAAADAAGSCAPRYPSAALGEALRVAGLGPSDVDLTIGEHTHEPAMRGVRETTNCLPRRLDDAVRARRIAVGDVVLLVTCGTGLTWSWAVVRW